MGCRERSWSPHHLAGQNATAWLRIARLCCIKPAPVPTKPGELPCCHSAVLSGSPSALPPTHPLHTPPIPPQVMEFLRIAPRGLGDVHKMLFDTGGACLCLAPGGMSTGRAGAWPATAPPRLCHGAPCSQHTSWSVRASLPSIPYSPLPHCHSVHHGGRHRGHLHPHAHAGIPGGLHPPHPAAAARSTRKQGMRRWACALAACICTCSWPLYSPVVPVSSSLLSLPRRVSRPAEAGGG